MKLLTNDSSSTHLYQLYRWKCTLIGVAGWRRMILLLWRYLLYGPAFQAIPTDVSAVLSMTTNTDGTRARPPPLRPRHHHHSRRRPVVTDTDTATDPSARGKPLLFDWLSRFCMCVAATNTAHRRYCRPTAVVSTLLIFRRGGRSRAVFFTPPQRTRRHRRRACRKYNTNNNYNILGTCNINYNMIYHYKHTLRVPVVSW